MSKPTTLVTFALLLAVAPATTFAHYLWISVDDTADGTSTVNVFFEEGPLPGPGDYNEPLVARLQSWVRTAGTKPVAVETKEVMGEGTKWLAGTTQVDAPRSVEAYLKFGVYRYGQTDVLLHYHAKYLDAVGPADLAKLARSEDRLLDVVPSWKGGKLTATVLWKGEPAVDRPVKVRGPKGFPHANVQTDDRGTITIEPTVAGRYRLLTNVDWDEAGTYEEKAFTKVRHHSSLSIALPVGGE